MPPQWDTLVTKLGFYFLPPVYYTTPVNQSYDMTDQSPSPSIIAAYDGSEVAGQTSSTAEDAFVFTSLCPTGGSNIGSQSRAVLTGGSSSSHGLGLPPGRQGSIYEVACNLFAKCFGSA
jgi:hypothetical protein